MKRLFLLAMLISVVGCSKQSDDAPPQALSPSTTPPSPSPKNPCDRGGTVVINNDGGISSSQTSTHTLTIPIPNFMPSCGDTINVFLSNPGQNNWFPVVEAPTAQPNWYTKTTGSVSIHNGTQVQQDWSFSATEK